jgi:hypothetical protein
MAGWSKNERGTLDRVTVRSSCCGRPMLIAQRVRDEHLPEDYGTQWDFPDAIQPRGGHGRPSLMPGPDWTNYNWAFTCDAKRHGRPCGQSFAVRPDRLRQALDRAYQYGRNDITTHHITTVASSRPASRS